MSEQPIDLQAKMFERVFGRKVRKADTAEELMDVIANWILEDNPHPLDAMLRTKILGEGGLFNPDAMQMLATRMREYCAEGWHYE